MENFRCLLVCALLVLCLSTTTFAIEYQIEPGAVVAVHDGKVVWRNVHDVKNLIKDKHGPVLAGKYLYYSIGSRLYQVQADTGIVQRHIQLPGYCRNITAQGDGVVVQVVSALRQMTWSKTLVITPDSDDVPFTISASILDFAVIKRDAAQIAKEALHNAAKARQLSPVPPEATWKSDKSVHPCVEQVVTTLDELTKRDPSNLWYVFYQGWYLDKIGRNEEATTRFKQMMERSQEYPLQLLGMVHQLDQLAPPLGDEAFDKDMQLLLAKGYEPECMNILIALMIFYGNPQQREINPVKELAYANKLGLRIWHLAPYAEASCFMFHALAQANAQSGDTKMAAIWQERCAAATPYRVFGGANDYAERAGHAITLFIAGGTALFFFLVVKFLCTIATYRRTPKLGLAGYNFFAYLPKGENLAFILVIALGLVAAYTIHVGVRAVSNAAAMPISSLSGFPGHPDSLEYFQKLRDNDSGRFVYALLLQKSGDLDAADQIYQQLDLAQALNNRGIIAHQRGDTKKAQDFFEKAWQKDAQLTVAAFNLGKAVSSPAIERRVAYGGKGPFLAMPTSVQWSRMLASGQFRSWWEFFRMLSGLQDFAALTPVAFFAFFGYGYLALALFALMALFQKRQGEQDHTPNTLASVEGLTWILPGTSRYWSVAGLLILTLFFFSAQVSLTLANNGGIATNIIEAIAVPGAAKAYGVGELFLPPMSSAVYSTRHLWWILLIVNAVYLAIMIRKAKNFARKA